jgi:hypothetical protein
MNSIRKSVLLLLLLSFGSFADSYIISAPVLPRRKQIAWLNKMTENFCSTAPGKLSHEMLESANDLIYAWAHMESKECALKVESLVKRVVDERRAGNLEATMTLIDYNLLLEGWARSKAGTAAAERCEQIMSEMQEHPDIVPDLDSFKTVLMAWRVSSDPKAAPRAQKFLEYMMKLYASGQNPFAMPDADCFDIVLQLWARSASDDAPQQTENLVIAMERLYLATQKEQIRPKTTSFNAVLAAWAKSQNPDSGKHVMEILRFMETHAQLGDTSIEPDMVSYSTCIAALTRHQESPEKAENLLKHVEEAAKDGNSRLVPDTILYNSVMSCWAHSTIPGAYRKARSILDRQMNFHKDLAPGAKSKPDVYGFTSVLASCAMEPKEKYKAFQVALATFQQLRHSEEYGAPNHVTYGTMLKCCARLLCPTNPVRRKWVQTIMNQCIDDGLVGDMVMSRFREAATPDLYREIMNNVDKKNLPSSWTVNVCEKRECRKKKTRRAAEV